MKKFLKEYGVVTLAIVALIFVIWSFFFGGLDILVSTFTIDQAFGALVVLVGTILFLFLRKLISSVKWWKASETWLDLWMSFSSMWHLLFLFRLIINNITIIGHLFTFSSMVWLALYLIKSRKREFISHEIKLGTACYRCKTKIKDLDYWTIDKNEHKRELCLSCKRDEALKTVMNKKDVILSFLYKIDFTDNKWYRYFLYLSATAVIFNLGNLFLPGLNIVGGLCLFFAQALFYYRFMSITRKKETQSN